VSPGVCHSYWSPLALNTSSEVAFGDGGSADNLAVTPLLRRRVTKMVVAVAAMQNVSSVADAADWAGEMCARCQGCATRLVSAGLREARRPHEGYALRADE
jgi:hypothetical protein